METGRKRAFKGALFEQFARLAQALASGRRLELLELLAQRPRTVEELAAETGLSLANASQHLQVLRRVRLVEVSREGVHARYRLADDDVFRLWRALREAGEVRLADIERLVRTYLHDRDALEPVNAAELQRRLRSEGLLVLDVRPGEEYEAGHIAGAVSVPITELRGRLREIPRQREVVAYCRGPYCVFADEAVQLLRAHGFRARRLGEGLPDWRAMGLPVEAGPGMK